MPLKKGSSQKMELQNFCHQHADTDHFCSFCRVSPMLNCMTICANCFQIFNIVIFSIFIHMMHLKNKLIFNSASFTTYFAKLFICLSKSFNRIIFNAKCCFVYGRAFSRTVLPKTIIHFIATNDHFSAANARVALDAFNRAITSFPTQFICSKLYIASYTCSGFIVCLIRAFFRTIFLFNTTSAVVQFKCCITNKAIAHGEQYATS